MAGLEFAGMKTLYIGGTGEISYSCIHAGAALGHQIVLFNRGKCSEPLPAGVEQIHGDLADDTSYRKLGERQWDVVCQFRAYDVAAVERDLAIFSGKVGQYVFISSASVYSKPPQSYVLTEDHPTENAYWEYSRNKARAEERLRAAHAAGDLPVTILRPSHTYRRNFPGGAISGDEMAWRMLRGKPIIVHGDGTSLWTYTHAEDFARPFVRLLGNAKALGETFHLTAHMRGYTWNQIYATCAAALGVDARLVHIPTATLVRSKPDLQGNLMGDKMWPSLFDNSKVRGVAGAFEEKVTLDEGLRGAAVHVRKRMESHVPDEALHAWVDRVIAAQNAVGT